MLYSMFLLVIHIKYRNGFNAEYSGLFDIWINMMCQDLEAEEAVRTRVTGKPMKSRDTVQTLSGHKLVGRLNTLYFKLLVAKGLKSYLNFIYISHRLILILGPLTAPSNWSWTLPQAGICFCHDRICCQSPTGGQCHEPGRLVSQRCQSVPWSLFSFFQKSMFRSWYLSISRITILKYVQ